MSCLYAHGFARSRSRMTGRATLPRARGRCAHAGAVPAVGCGGNVYVLVRTFTQPCRVAIATPTDSDNALDSDRRHAFDAWS